MGLTKAAAKVRSSLMYHALAMPEAWLDHPWGEDVVKVKKKVFVFLGMGDGSYPPNLTVKLTDSRDQALGVAGAEPSGYGLGKSGWVTVPLETKLPPLRVLCDWVDESYRNVAPKGLAAALDELRQP